MKNTILNTIGTATLAVLMMMALAQIQASAQENISEEKSGELTQEELQKEISSHNNPRALEGSWNSQVTIRNCQTGDEIRNFPAMNTFMQGGTMQEYGVGSGLLRGSGHGVWTYLSGRRFSSNFQFFRYNADGTFAGRQINRRQLELSRFGSTLNVTATVEVYNPTGVLVGTACATEFATRFE